MVRTSPSYEGTVAAIIVARGMTPALRSLLDALDKQSRLPDQLIVCDVRAPRTSPGNRCKTMIGSGSYMMTASHPRTASKSN